MNTETLVLNLLVLAVSGGTATIVGLMFRRISDIGRDVKEISVQVGTHTAALARNDEKLAQLRRDVDGLIDRERARAA